MLNRTEEEERAYLRDVYQALEKEEARISEQIQQYHGQILATKKYMYENQSELDTAEKALNRVSVADDVAFGEDAKKQRDRINRLKQAPYFGRIDFHDGDGEHTIYISVNGFLPEGMEDNLIYDWRAPVSSIFYDFEKGPAFYAAPSGSVEGLLTVKRQYKTIGNHMEYMIESDLNIGDAVLQKELSLNADQKMKTIVATIQREQNKIIRDETTKVMIIQGVAGSGKTSIALHRIAFLLYRNQDTLKSENILIISPNKVFSEYISNVLPELGEETMLQMELDAVIASYLGSYRYQTFAMQVETLLHAADDDMIARISWKASNQFVNQLHSFLRYAEEAFFTAKTVRLGDVVISGSELQDYYHNLHGYPVQIRLKKTGDHIISRYQRQTQQSVGAAGVKNIHDRVQSMFRVKDAFSFYQAFYAFVGHPEYFQTIDKNTLEYCDVYPYVYVKLFFSGVEETYPYVKHLLVDEMQDYTPIQYAVLAKLFTCKMTILGDEFQRVNPYSASSWEKICPYFSDCEIMELHKSYRSTYEISEFARSILENQKLVSIERHGRKPQISQCADYLDMVGKILDLVKNAATTDYKTLGIVCRSQQEADRMYENLRNDLDSVLLLHAESTSFQEGVVITSVHMAKGLEFDWVIVPDTSARQYHTVLDRNLLYIACTRAMHRLDLLYYGTLSTFITVA